MRPTPGPALGPGPTSAWAGPAAAARLWLSYQGNCGAGADESAGMCLCGTAAGGVTVSAQLYIYCITRYQYDVFAVYLLYIVHYTVCIYHEMCIPCVSTGDTDDGAFVDRGRSSSPRARLPRHTAKILSPRKNKYLILNNHFCQAKLYIVKSTRRALAVSRGGHAL